MKLTARRCPSFLSGRRHMAKKQMLAAALVLLVPLTMLAQTNATVGGTVSDASGAVIPGVEVTARNVNTGIESVQLSQSATWRLHIYSRAAGVSNTDLPEHHTQPDPAGSVKFHLERRRSGSD